MPNTLTFTSGVVSVIAPGVLTPYSKAAEKIQVTGETDGGTVFVYTKASTQRYFTARLPKLTQAVFDALYDFWNTTVNGKATTFTLTDEDGAVYTTARFWDEKLRWTKHQLAEVRYDMDLLLRIG